MPGSRQEEANPNVPILSVRPPVLLSYEPRVDSSIEKGTHFLRANQDGVHVTQTPALSIPPFQRLSTHLMSVILFPGCPMASLGHMGITNQSLQPGGGVALGQPCDRKRQIDRYLHSDAHSYLPLLPPLPQRLGVRLTPGPEQRRPARATPSHSHPSHSHL